ncbi:uncharacterized protein LOC143880376 isoform X1 [Tasmannia lanceolata]|uniref:uncharacterized protein LOC143880376 isoform X1 n=1 Tax=Tasmannia lanceolata TaxID=3420 RepID=UPI0040631E93
MPTRLENLTSLVELSIATQLPLFSKESALPMTIQDLQIFSCDNLMSLPKGMQSLTSLKKLVIRECPQLHSLFPDDENNDYGLPTELDTLEIHTCPNLKSLLKGMQSLTSLKILVIRECPQLHSLFPDDENNDYGLPTELNTLEIHTCPNLKSLLKVVQSLEELVIRECPQLHSLFLDDENWLPTTLITLDISAFLNLKSLPKGMQSLPSLKKLVINSCPQLFSLFPDDNNNEYGLPTTLVHLSIQHCENLKSLPNRMQNLTSLELLFIWNCPEISSLPEDGLPTTLTSLYIFGCPKLTERCQKNSGQDWPKIQHCNLITDGTYREAISWCW